MKTTSSKPEQFDFEQKWKSEIVPHLDDRQVVTALTFGMNMNHLNYSEGEPPWLYGRGWWSGQRATKGSLSWYQPFGLCQGIAPFCWALGKKVIPQLHWGCFGGKEHAVAVGWSDNPDQPEYVMDILHFQIMSAQQSLDFAKQRNGRYYDTLSRYFSSFFDDPEVAYQFIEDARIEAGIAQEDEGVALIEMLIDQQCKLS
jgi:hypothetical protein